MTYSIYEYNMYYYLLYVYLNLLTLFKFILKKEISYHLNQYYLLEDNLKYK